MLGRFKRLFSRKVAYQHTFLGDNNEPHVHAAAVLADLKRFCYAERSTAMVSPVSGVIDPVAMGMAEGRREVFNRIVGFLRLDDAAISRLKEPDIGNDND